MTTTQTTYGIDDGHGDSICTGVTEVAVWEMAQRLANERGEAVYVYDARPLTDDEIEDGYSVPSTEVEPESTTALPSTADITALAALVPEATTANESSVTVVGPNGSLTVWWDTQDPANEGWAWRMVDDAGHDSDSLDTYEGLRSLVAQVLQVAEEAR